MSIKKRLIPALVGATLAMSATGASAVSFNGVYIFGDSLSDAGYFRPFLSAIGLPASTVAGLGRFTTNPGPVWSEIIAQYYGGNANPSNAGGGIYAQGGARVAVDSASTPPVAATQRPVSTQITEYLNANSGRANANSLYGVWAGANDIFQNFAGIVGGTVNPATFIPALATTEIQQIGRLSAAGAKYILVFNLPNLGATPQFSVASIGAAGSGAATQLAANFNLSLFVGLQQSGIRVIPVDTFSLFNDVIANAAAFGFTNTTSPACLAFPPFSSSPNSQFCGPTNLAAANAASTFVFADGVHPTSAAHAITADFVKSLIDGPNAYSMMAEVPLSSRAAHIRTLDEGLYQGQSAAIGKISVFAAAEGSNFDISQTAFGPRTDTKNKAVTVGVTMRASDALTVGVAAGNTQGDARQGVGQFDINENALSLFGSARSGPWYANFMGSFADVKYEDIRRSVKLGNVTRVATANTEGSNVSGSLTGGYDHEWGRLTVGPFASITSQLVTVNEFTEAGAGSANLKIFEQTRRSRVYSGGLRASMKFGAWTPFARVSFDKENFKTPRVVTANPLTVTSGNSYDIPAYFGDTSWVTGSVGVRGKLADRVGLSVVYSAVSSKSNEKQDGVTASVSFDF
ncbi:MAG: autotransporter domain-containing protein [Betaproteobacteria bacterium]|nr:autotransporter domain-containing protein [Betaproteobacteria bacterium]